MFKNFNQKNLMANLEPVLNSFLWPAPFFDNYISTKYFNFKCCLFYFVSGYKWWWAVSENSCLSRQETKTDRTIPRMVDCYSQCCGWTFSASYHLSHSVETWILCQKIARWNRRWFRSDAFCTFWKSQIKWKQLISMNIIIFIGAS